MFNMPGKKGPKFYWLPFSDQETRLAQGRIFERGEKFKDRYQWPADVEAAMSEYDRRTGIKHLRIRGVKAVRFGATLKALGVNILKVATVRGAKMVLDWALRAA